MSERVEILIDHPLRFKRGEIGEIVKRFPTRKGNERGQHFLVRCPNPPFGSGLYYFTKTQVRELRSDELLTETEKQQDTK